MANPLNHQVISRLNYQGDKIFICKGSPRLTCDYCEEHNNYETEYQGPWKGSWRWVVLKSYCGHLIAQQEYDDGGGLGDYAVVWADGTEVKDEEVCAAQQTWEESE